MRAWFWQRWLCRASQRYERRLWRRYWRAPLPPLD